MVGVGQVLVIQGAALLVFDTVMAVLQGLLTVLRYRPQGLQGTTSDVLRRGRDGGWTYLIDAPFGLLA